MADQQTTGSIAPSKASITKSEVSMVDFKFQSNATKKKLRGLLKSVDNDKSGMVKHEVFFELLGLHKVSLTNEASNYLKKNYSKNQTINYKEALNQIAIDLNAAGALDDEGKGTMKWTVQAFQKSAKSQIGGDSISQVAGQAGGGGGMKRAGGGSDVKSGFSYLSVDKLKVLDGQADLKSRINEKLESIKSEVKSGVAKSQIGSIAPSKMKSVVSKLESIPEQKQAIEESGDRDDVESLYLGETSAYLKELHKIDRDNYEKLLHICKHVQDNHIDFRKFITLRQTVSTFKDQHGRRMSIEEMLDYIKALFSDLKFNDLLVKFCSEKHASGPSPQKQEKEYTIYVDIDKVQKLSEVIQMLPVIIRRDGNVSNSMNLLINEEKQKKDHQQKFGGLTKKQSEVSILNQNDPYLLKLLELIYCNIKKRFQVFGNAFCYLDFMNRANVSFVDFQRGMDGFNIRISVNDQKSVFCYLADCDGSDLSTAMMNFQQFMKLDEEKKARNIDPFELQVFQQQVSADLFDVEEQVRQNNDARELDRMSKAPGDAYKGLQKAKKLAKKQRDTNSLPKHIRENMQAVQFGIGTLPSDNMKMVMNNDFNHDFIRKLKERQIIEHELEKIANLQQKNAKYNIYLTKSQHLRNQVTKQTMEQQAALAAMEKGMSPGASGMHRSQSQGSPRSLLDKAKANNLQSQQLPALKTKKNDEEAEIQNLIKKNLLFDKDKMSKLIPNTIQRDTKPQQALRASELAPIPKVAPIIGAPMRTTESVGKISAVPSAAASAQQRQEKDTMLSDYFSKKSQMNKKK